MLTRLPLLLLLLISTTAIAQKPKLEYYLYNKEWKAAKDVASAEYVVQTTNIGDSLFINRIFKGAGYLWRQESYKDADQTIANGVFAWYGDDGKVDSLGYVNHGKKDRNWQYYDDTLGVYYAVNYENGKEIERRDYINKTIVTAAGTKTFDEEKREKDSVKESNKAINFDEKEAQFKGGVNGFKKYLEQNLVPPTDLVKTGVVRLLFYINKVGKLENLVILQSLQLTADIEALRVIGESPDWVPARQNGKNVVYQALQYLTFQVN